MTPPKRSVGPAHLQQRNSKGSTPVIRLLRCTASWAPAGHRRRSHAPADNPTAGTNDGVDRHLIRNLGRRLAVVPDRRGNA